MPKVTFKTQPCRFCGRVSVFILDGARIEAWKAGALIQDVFPDLSADEREVIISGTCSSCWDRFMGGDDAD